jgi:hypothetical protein
MKTTVEIEDKLLKQAKRAAVDRNCTLRELIERGLRRELAAGGQPKPPIQWVTASGPWPEGLDLRSREAMYEWIGRRDRD